MFATLSMVLVIASSGTILLLVEANQRDLFAQNQTLEPTNFTKIFSTDREFQRCIEGITINGLTCVPEINVIYEDSTLLVLQSEYTAIWKGVAMAKKEGYKIDSMTSFLMTSLFDRQQKINLLVAMSR